MSTIQQHARSGTAPTSSVREPGVVARRRPRGVTEVLVLAGAWVVYSVARGLAQGTGAVARIHALDIWDVEKYLHIDFEPAVNAAASSVTWLGVGMSFWYATLHYLVTPSALLWLYLRRPESYRRARTALVTGSAIALVFYVLLPTAPPRLTSDAFVDTLSRYSSYGWWSDHASAPAGLGQLTDELAAMPSLHVGWTLWVVWALWRHVGRTVRTLTVLYSAGTTFVVIGTGNHWLLDAVAGGAVIAAGIVLSRYLDASAAADRVRTTLAPRAWWVPSTPSTLRVWLAVLVAGREAATHGLSSRVRRRCWSRA